MFRSIAITFIALISAWPSLPSQVYDQESAIQLDQLSFSISDLPMILNLAQTFSNASLGVQSDAFQRWVNEHPLDSSMETLRELVIKFQSAVKVHSTGSTRLFYKTTRSHTFYLKVWSLLFLIQIHSNRAFMNAQCNKDIFHTECTFFTMPSITSISLLESISARSPFSGVSLRLNGNSQ